MEIELLGQLTAAQPGGRSAGRPAPPALSPRPSARSPEWLKNPRERGIGDMKVTPWLAPGAGHASTMRLECSEPPCRKDWDFLAKLPKRVPAIPSYRQTHRMRSGAERCPHRPGAQGPTVTERIRQQISDDPEMAARCVPSLRRRPSCALISRSTPSLLLYAGCMESLIV